MAFSLSSRGSLFKSCMAEYLPQAKAPIPQFIAKICSHCDKLERENVPPFTPCSSCSFVSYCTSACQLAAFREHKVECAHLRGKLPVWSNITDVVIAGKALLIFRLILSYESGKLQEERVKFPCTYSYPSRVNGKFQPIGDEDEKLQQLKAAVDHLYGKSIDSSIFADVCIELRKVKATDVQFFYRVACGEAPPVGFTLTLGSAALQHSCCPNVQTYFTSNTLCVLPLPTHAWKPAVNAARDVGSVRIAHVDLTTTKGVRRFELQRFGVLDKECMCERCTDPEDDLLSAIRCFSCGDAIPIDDTLFRRSPAARFRELSMTTRKRLETVFPQLSVVLTRDNVEHDWEYFGDAYKELLLTCSICGSVQPGERVEFALAMMSAVELLCEAERTPIEKSAALSRLDSAIAEVLPDCNVYAASWNNFFARLPSTTSADRCERLRKCYEVVERCFPFGHHSRFGVAIPLCHALLANGRFDEAELVFDELRGASELFYGFGNECPFFRRLVYLAQCVRERRNADHLFAYKFGEMTSASGMDIGSLSEIFDSIMLR